MTFVLSYEMVEKKIPKENAVSKRGFARRFLTFSFSAFAVKNPWMFLICFKMSETKQMYTVNDTLQPQVIFYKMIEQLVPVDFAN